MKLEMLLHGVEDATISTALFLVNTGVWLYTLPYC